LYPDPDLHSIFQSGSSIPKIKHLAAKMKIKIAVGKTNITKCGKPLLLFLPLFLGAFQL